MMLRCLLGLSMVYLLVAVTASADIVLDVTWPATGGTVSLPCAPDGSGRFLDEAVVFGGGSFDATIRVALYDYTGGFGRLLTPSDVPLDDVFLVSTNFNVINACWPSESGPIGFPSHFDGIHYVFDGPLFASGAQQPYGSSFAVVALSGGVEPFMSEEWYNGLGVNSADINRDGVVNLTDGGLFSSDLFGTYHYRSDFVYDGAVNLSDAGYFATLIGSACP